METKEREVGVQWEKLPKILWAFDEKSTIITKLCIQNLNNSASVSNFKLIVLTEKSIVNYMSPILYQTIYKAFK